MNKGDGLRSLQEEDLQRLDALLRAFLAESGAKSAFVLDRTGRLLTSVGESASFDETTFASLAAADFAASDQLAILLGENEFTSLYHQGEAGSMYLSDVAGHAILAAVFDRRTTLGMVRLKTRSVLPKVVELFNELVGRATSQKSGLDAGWLDDATDEIDRLFAG